MGYFIKRKDNTIEPEEILLDKKSQAKRYEKIERPISKGIFFAFLLLIVLIVFILLGRAFYLQILKGDEFVSQAQENKAKSYYLQPKRGIIYDRNLNQLVLNDVFFDLVLYLDRMPKGEERKKILNEIAKKFNLSKEELLKLKDEISNSSTSNDVVVLKNIQKTNAIYTKVNLNKFPMLYIKERYVRNYKFQSLSHVIGYLGRVTKLDLKTSQDLTPNDYVGKTGVEKVYDKLLRGKKGVMVKITDSTLNVIETKKIKDPKDGNNLILTIDLKLQEKAYKALKDAILKNKDAKGGVVIVTNPKTGEILALANYPSFDANIFSSLNKNKNEYLKIINNKSRPLFNRAISGTYSPGSSIKPFIAAAALQEQIITEKTSINDNLGYISITNKYNPEIKYIFRDWKVGGHGITDVKKAIAVSSNVFFYTIGGGYGGIEGLGIERIKEYLNKFWFGKLTGIDLPGEKVGVIPTPEWKKSYKGEDWYIGDTYITSIGQGNMLITPIQMATALSSLVNDGKVIRLYILKEISDALNQKTIKKSEIKELNSGFVDKRYFKIVKEGMRMAVLNGSAQRLKNFPVEIAGKTGTAQTNGAPHSWFISFAPYKDPEIAVVVLVENGGEGSATAIPIAKKVYEAYFGIEK